MTECLSRSLLIQTQPNVSPAQEASSKALASSQGRHNSHQPAGGTEETSMESHRCGYVLLKPPFLVSDAYENTWGVVNNYITCKVCGCDSLIAQS